MCSDVLQVDIHKVVAQVFSTLSTLKKGDVQMWNDIDDSTPNIMADSGRVVQVRCPRFQQAELCRRGQTGLWQTTNTQGRFLCLSEWQVAEQSFGCRQLLLAV